MSSTSPPTRRSRRLGVLAAAAVAIGMLSAQVAAQPASAQPATASASAAGAATSGYIVTLEPDGAGVSTLQQLPVDQGDVSEVFDSVLDGFAAELTADEAARLEADPRVANVEPDGRVQTTGVQASPSWGLDRIDQHRLPLDRSFTFPDTGGKGVRVYVVDTGVRRTHVEFGTRVTSGFTAYRDSVGTGDCNGHGTHVAGTVAGSTYGVARQAQIVPVRVLDCQGGGNWSDVIAGLDWIAANHPGGPAVVNMSLGGGYLESVNTAVERLVARGIVVVVAAGNWSDNACFDSPASAPSALTVGSTDWNDRRSWFSNHGPCLDIFAPGESIPSAWFDSDRSVVALDGTSMASPHVAGVAAVVAGASPGLSPAQVQQQLFAASGSNLVHDAGWKSPNRLLRLPAAAPSGCGFVDVGESAYYAKSACWALAAGVTTGKGGTSFFAPGDTVDRAQMVTFLWRAAGKPAAAVRCGFTDTSSTAYYAQAVCWAKQQGIITGRGNGTIFDPGARLTRAEAATIMWRAAGSPAGTNRCGFTDVPANSYYAVASCWMLRQGITEGLRSAATFAPKVSVDRGQGVTFLWRSVGKP